jgi:hypothetical protein
VTFIHRNSLENIPLEVREGASAALSNALNIRNREPKLRKFGFSTSEDALTWVVFVYLLRSGRLLAALAQAGIFTTDLSTVAPTLLLWGSTIDNGPRGPAIREQLTILCSGLHEDPNSLSEPDVIVDLGEKGLAFIEVKHLSGNDNKAADYPGWSRYASSACLAWSFDDVKESGCYELARNWCLMKGIAAERNATLVNLGPPTLFKGRAGACLDRFGSSVGVDDRSKFVKMTWSRFLSPILKDAPNWFVQFCRGRGLTA